VTQVPGPPRIVVVDGSNLATEGRTTPSLAQLDDAVRSYQHEDPDAQLVVVVDASFGHRIDPSERAQLEQAELHGELVAPPAGAIGRGDAFVLRIAERTGAIVLSNDSFQEFHAEHPWLFDDGRLIGGKPVPGVGWIFTPRRPVRSSRSQKVSRGEVDGDGDDLTPPRKAAEVAKALKKSAPTQGAKPAPTRKDAAAKTPAAKAAKKKQEPTRSGTGSKKEPAPVAKVASMAEARRAKGQPAAPASKKTAKAKKSASNSPAPTPRVRSSSGSRRQERVRSEPVGQAISEATAEVLASPSSSAEAAPEADKTKRRRSAPPPAVNEPLAFLTFVAEHSMGSTFQGSVKSFTSHGAMVDVSLPDGGVMHCYLPLTGLAIPPPRAAREVLRRGEQRDFALVSLDPPRRMAELALPDIADRLMSARSAVSSAS
jgi:hypothetical protein